MTTETIERTRDGTLWREAPPYFDDLEVGDSMESSGRTVTEYDVVSFAALTGDWHPQHADAAWAAESAFGRRIAHGMLVLSTPSACFRSTRALCSHCARSMGRC